MRAEWGWPYYEVCSISLRAVFPVKSSLFRLLVKLHCCIEMEGEGREGRRKKKKKGERKCESILRAAGEHWLALLLLFSAWELMDREACHAAVHGVAKSQTRLSD